MNIVFAGTPDFAVASLKALHESPHEVIAVYTQPDRPAGRGRKLQPSPVKQYALEHRIPVYQPSDFKDPRQLERLAALNPDAMIVVAYGLILPQAVLDIPRLGCLNVHASLLPKWRGAAPIQRAIEAGDPKTGVTIMRMEAGLDTGPMLNKAETQISETDTAANLHDRLAALGAGALLETLDQLEQGEVKPVAQEDAAATYADKLTKAEAKINWTTSAREIARRVRAFNPWPVAETRWGGKRLRIFTASTEASESGPPGTVNSITNDAIGVATGDGSVLIQELQLEGGRRQTVREFLNGHSMQVGDRLDN